MATQPMTMMMGRTILFEITKSVLIDEEAKVNSNPLSNEKALLVIKYFFN